MHTAVCTLVVPCVVSPIVGRCHTQQAVQKMFNIYQKGPVVGCLRDYKLYVQQENIFSTYLVQIKHNNL